ncbi:MAG: TraR/DksA C4-type zinc finger protein [Eggerthellaceae bacterium]|nr:TraR/DksA C4-type zinc finger protein [Eggerthellaceae bacterium]
MLDVKYWDKVAEFHGHKCPGLALGFKVVEGAIAELGLDDANLPAIDEEIVCVTENDACCVDAVQVLLGCTYGKSNLIPRIRGKIAFTFFNRATGKGVRLAFKPGCGEGMGRDEYMNYLVNTPYEEIYDVKEPTFALPEEARIFKSHVCAVCGENTAEYALRVQDDKLVCVDCYDAYDREGF